MRAICFAFIAALLTACGGGGGGADTPAAPAPAPPAAIRFQGVYQPLGRTLTIGPVAGDAAIATNPVARVEVETNNDTTVALAAANSADAQGRPQYVLTLPDYPAQMFRTCSPFLPLRVTVTDTAGLVLTKHVIYCPAQEQSFGGFSDYGTRSVRFVATASAPTLMEVARFGAGRYWDILHTPAVTVLDQAFAAREGDRAQADPNFNGAAPQGTTMTLRIEGSGGAFAESASLIAPGVFRPLTELACCRVEPSADNAAPKRIRLSIAAVNSTGAVPSPEGAFSFSYRLSDPVTGAAIIQESGNAIGQSTFFVDARIGQQLAVEAAPTDPQGQLGLSVQNVTEVVIGNAAQTLATAQSNRRGVPARLNVFCCSK